ARRLLDRARLLEPGLVAAYWSSPLDSVRALVSSAALNCDDRPVVEYSAARDLVEVGRAWLLGHPDVLGRVPFVPAMPAAPPLSSAWRPADWYRERTRWLIEEGDSVRAARTVAAARAAVPEAAAEISSLYTASVRRAQSRAAVEQATNDLAGNRPEEARAALE